MKTLEWTPVAMHVAERRDRLVALLIQDPGETIAFPMSRGDARELGAALVALADELDERFGAELPGAKAPRIHLDGPVH